MTETPKVRSKTAQLEADLAALRQDTGVLHEKLRTRDARILELEKRCQDLTIESNGIRAQLLDALMDGERMRGYLDGTVDAEAPAMVPAQRERRLDRYTGTPRREDELYAGMSGGYRSGREERPKRWFER